MCVRAKREHQNGFSLACEQIVMQTAAQQVSCSVQKHNYGNRKASCASSPPRRAKSNLRHSQIELGVSQTSPSFVTMPRRVHEHFFYMSDKTIVIPALKLGCLMLRATHQD